MQSAIDEENQFAQTVMDATKQLVEETKGIGEAAEATAVEPAAEEASPSLWEKLKGMLPGQEQMIQAPASVQVSTQDSNLKEVKSK